MRKLRRALAALIAGFTLVAVTGAGATARTDVEVTVTPNQPGATYLYGQGITLTATTDPPSDEDHWHWFIKEPHDEEFEVSHFGEGAELDLPHSMTWDGAQVYAELYDHDHQVVGTSAPVTLHVDRLPPATELTAATDRPSYRVGDVAALTSTQTPPTGEDHYHWYLRPRGEEYFTWVDGTSAATAELALGREHDGAEVIVRLFDHDHLILAESAPIRLRVAKATTALTTRVANAPLAARERPRLDVRLSSPVPPTGQVKVRVDGRVRATTDAARRTSVVLPRLNPGQHRLRVVYGGDAQLERSVVARGIRVRAHG